MKKRNKNYDMTCEEVVEVLKYNIQYVRILAREGKLPAVSLRRQWFFCREDIMVEAAEQTKEVINARVKRSEKRKKTLAQE